MVAGSIGLLRSAKVGVARQTPFNDSPLPADQFTCNFLQIKEFRGLSPFLLLRGLSPFLLLACSVDEPKTPYVPKGQTLEESLALFRITNA